MMRRWVPRKQRWGACQCVVYGSILNMKIGYTEDLVCLRFNGKDLMAEYISDLEVKYIPKLMLYIIKMHN